MFPASETCRLNSDRGQCPLRPHVGNPATSLEQQLHNLPSLCTFVYRAGRDGAPSLSLLYCSQADLKQLKKLEKPVGAQIVAALS